MVNRLILANLVTRPVRTLLSVMAVAIEVVLILLVVGLSYGMLRDSAERTQGVGADIMVQPATASVFMGFGGAPMPVQLAQKLAAIPGVKAVAPVVVQTSSGAGLTLIWGIDPASFDAVSGGFQYLAGGGLKGPDDVLVDDMYANGNHVRVGQSLSLLNHDFRISGIVEHGRGGRIFVQMDRLQDLLGSTGKCSIFFVKLTQPALTGTVLEQIRQMLPGYQVRDMAEYMSLMVGDNIPGLSDFINAMISLAVAIGLIVIFVTMYSSMIERTREIGILKSLGASRGWIFSLVLRETTFLTVFGIGAGIGMSYGVRALVRSMSPAHPILITPDWVLRAALIALAASLAGAAYPAVGASRRDPLDALAYE